MDTRLRLNGIRIVIVCLFVLSLTGLGCNLGQIFQPTQTPTRTHTSTPSPTNTPTPTDTPTLTYTPSPSSTDTPIPTSTHTPSPTPTIYPLSDEDVLADILLQEDDLIEFFQDIGVPTDGFVDGSQLEIDQWGNYFDKPIFYHWGADLPDDIVSSYTTYYDSNRVFSGRAPTFIAFHSAAIYIFPSAGDAHSFFTSDTRAVDSSLIKPMSTLGDESIAFSGVLVSTGRPVGGVIWRYHEAYVFVCAHLNFQVTPDSLMIIAGNIQARLIDVIDR